MKFNKETQSLTSFVWVGDMHVKKDNIEESERLINWIDSVAMSHGLPIVFSGDQYNDFGIARVEAVKFWERSFRDLKSPAVALVGNHDANSDMSLNFMDIHSDYVLVIDKPTVLTGANNTVVGLLPFYRNNDHFVKYMTEFPTNCNTLICHQEFNGCKYENGFFSPHGVDPTLIPNNIQLVIGGHIHKEQSFGKIWYPGTPRQLTRSDCDSEKGIFLVDLKNTNNTKKVPTPENVCEPYLKFTITPEYKGNYSEFHSSRVFVDIIGPEAFVKSASKKMPDGAKFRTFPESEVVETEVKESEGIPKAFIDFTLKYADNNGLGAEEIKIITQKIYDKCPILKGNL